ncbi:MAG TPA: Wzz/FepE/Etk N-terminal domain-containing protein [Crocinitomicaceae bacterium]|nr:Wzz/FepE/Etk N-terminal domain-containing protein [Crocinitomicaceae bacterium]
MEEQRNNLVVFLWKKRKPIILLSAIGGIVALTISFFITPQFLSTAIIYPTATSTVSFDVQRNAKASAMDFGEDEQSEQMLQILKSSKIRDLVVTRFDLMKHYKIKENDPYKKHKLGNAYNEHIKFERTKYNSIKIDVLDEDAQLAADIANKIVDLYDSVKNEMIKERTIPAFEINIRKRKMIEESIKELSILLDTLSEMGVVPSESRANLFEAYNNAKTPEDKRFFKDKIDVNLKFGAEYDGKAVLLEEKMSKLSDFEAVYEQAESDAYADFNHKFVVETADKADRKEKPKKLIIAIVATLATFVFAVFYFLIVERLKELRKAE